MQSGRDLTLGGSDRLPTAETADMGRADVRDHGDIRLGATRQAGNLPRPPHAHLHHDSAMVRPGLQQCERHADVVVVVAFTGHQRPQRRQRRPDQFAGGGLARGTRHRHQRQGQGTAVLTGQQLVGIEGVIDTPVQQTLWQGLVPVSGHDGGLSSAGGDLLEIRMAIESFSHQGHEEPTGLHPAAVGDDRAHRLLRVQGCPPRLSPEIDQLLNPQSHAEAGMSYRIMPTPTRAERPRRRSAASTRRSCS